MVARATLRDMRTTCLTEDEFALLAEGRLEGGAAAEAELHARDCGNCNRLMTSIGDAVTRRSGLGRPRGESSNAGAALEPGARVGRFVLTRLLGTGGMGAVWAAHDPELGRDVALKLVRPGPGSIGDSAQNRDRLLQEAKAMANLAHPNVVPVFEVGMLGDELFVVMELVEGETLRSWISRPHSVPEILRVFAGAGLGLAAAHAKGIVHRDFKPENVLMGKDERPRVTDFGLARMVPGPRKFATPRQAALSETARSDGTETPRGALMGTPAYMAPEQFDGGVASEASDLFSFCTVFYEALYGVRPFVGSTVYAVRTAMRAGRARLPTRPRLPAAVRKLLLQGLRYNATERPASMAEIAAVLSRDTGARALKVAFVTTLVATLVLGAWSVSRARICKDAGTRLAGVWDPPRQSKVESAFLATHLVYAPDAYQRVAAAFERFRTGWTSNYTNACEQSAAASKDDPVAYLRMACLTQQLAAAQSKSDLFAQADEKVVEVAAAIASSLDDPASCASAAGRSAPPPPNLTDRLAVEHLREKLVRARALGEAGRFAESLSLANAAVDESRATHWPPMRAEALFTLAQTQREMDDAQPALETATDAALAAEGTRHDGIAARAWVLAVHLCGGQLNRAQQGRELMRHARAAVERLGSDDDLAAQLENAEGNLLGREGKLIESEQAQRRALAFYEATGKQDQFYTWLLNDEAVSLSYLGRDDEAAPLFKRTAEIKERVLGPHHPDVGLTLSNLANSLTLLGRYDESQAALDRAAEILGASLRPDHAWTMALDNNLGDLAHAKGDHPTALRWYERAMEANEAGVRSGHAFSLTGVTGVANTLVALGKPLEAIALQEKALDTGHPFDPAERAIAQFVLAKARVAAGGDSAAPLALAEQARATLLLNPLPNRAALSELNAWVQKQAPH